jgi:hypothetical protein
MKPLNGWKRIGIILSVLWVVGGGLLVRGVVKDVEYHWQESMVAQLSAADQAAVLARDLSKVSDGGLDVMYAAYAAATSVDSRINSRTAIWTFGPLLLVWLLVYVVIWLTRWVRAGF